MSSEGLESSGSLLKTPLIVRRDASVVLEWGYGLGQSRTRELAVTHRGRTWMVDEHLPTATDTGKGSVTRCGTAL